MKILRNLTHLQESTRAITRIAEMDLQYILLKLYRLFSVSPQRQSVVLFPDLSSARLAVVESVALVDTSGLLAGSGQTSSLSVLVHRVADPVVVSVSSDRLVEWVH